MKCVIKLYGQNREARLDGLNRTGKYEVCAYTDKAVSNLEKCIDGIPVWSIYKVAELYKKKEIDKVILSYDIPAPLMGQMVSEIVYLGIDREDILVIKPEFFEDYDVDMICTYSDFRRLPYLEFHVADHCNLNCKGCSHFSPMVKGEKFPNFEDVEKDFIQLKKVVDYIDAIHILGGEPFLNKELGRYVEMCRRIYPYAKIEVVTNGLLLKQVKDELFDVLRRCDAGILISVYPVLLAQMDSILQYAQSKAVRVNCLQTIQSFAYIFDSEGGHADKAKNINCPCINLVDGCLTPCPQIAYAKYFNEAFNENIDAEDGRINIYDESLTYPALLKELRKVRNACDRCFRVSREQLIVKEWEQTKEITISDYVYRED